MKPDLERIASFLAGIGIDVVEAEVPESSFLPGVAIASGRLVIDRARLRWPGDLLHEAGHIAVTARELRPRLDDRLADSADAPLIAEVEAIAWSYAAAVAIGLDPAVVFHPFGYGGRSAGLLVTFGSGVYPGAAGLEGAGMTLCGARAAAAGCRPYPHMLAWLRP